MKWPLIGSGDPHSRGGLLRNCMVAHGINLRHLWNFIIKQSMDLPQWPCFLRCLCHLGADWSTQNLRWPRSVLGHQLVLPRWGCRTHPCVDGTQSLPKPRMDPAHQHASPLGCHRDDATSNCSQLHQLDHSRVLIGLRHVPVSARLVAAQQLRALRCARRRFGLHGGAVVLVPGVGGHKH